MAPSVDRLIAIISFSLLAAFSSMFGLLVYLHEYRQMPITSTAATSIVPRFKRHVSLNTKLQSPDDLAKSFEAFLKQSDDSKEEPLGSESCGARADSKSMEKSFEAFVQRGGLDSLQGDCKGLSKKCLALAGNVEEAQESYLRTQQLRWQASRVHNEAWYLKDLIERMNAIEANVKQRQGDLPHMAWLLDTKFKLNRAKAGDAAEVARYMGVNITQQIQDWVLEWGLRSSLFPSASLSQEEKASYSQLKEKLQAELAEADRKMQDADKAFAKAKQAYSKQCSKLPLSPWVAGNLWTKGEGSQKDRRTNGVAKTTLEPRTHSLLGAPSHIWKLDPNLYPNRKNVSFVLQYFKRTDNIERIVDTLYNCTHGSKGDGELGPGVTSELLANVDDPSDYKEWFEAWHRTGDFLTPIFAHNVHEQRSYNCLARMATGKVVIFLQDDAIPPPSCQWVGDTLAAFQAWPKLGIVGLNIGVFSFHHGERRLGQDTGGRNILYKDPTTGLRMQFVTAVDVGPMAVARDVFLEVGQFNEMYSLPGENAVFHDYEIMCRVWLAGYQVAHLQMRPRGMDFGGDGGTHSGHQLAIRQKNEHINLDDMQRRFQQYYTPIYDEVVRLNKLLEPVYACCPDAWAHPVFWFGDKGPYCMEQHDYEKAKIDTTRQC